MAKDYDVVVLGAGPGGYVAAIRAAQLGMSVAVVEKEYWGGVCLNIGCIPSKALLHNAELLHAIRDEADTYGFTFDNFEADYEVAFKRSRKVSNRLVKGIGFLMKKNKIDTYDGWGNITGEGTVEVDLNEGGTETLTYKNLIIATGAHPASIPGVELDQDEVIISYIPAILADDVPEKVLVVGAGAIGLEFSYIWANYGVDITIVEMEDRVLPREDPDVSKAVEKAFKKMGVTIMTSSLVQSIDRTDAGAKVSVQTNDGTEEFEVDQVMVAIGFRPNVEGYGLDNIGVELNDRGAIAINEKMQTNVPNVYAIGDVTGKLMLAHVGSAMGLVAAETIGGAHTVELNYLMMPRATYCQPQVASFGYTEEQAREAGYEINVSRFPFSANGKALGLNDTSGFVKLISDAKYGEILGAHMVGEGVTELLPELTLAHFAELTPEEIARNVHAHPTLSEMLMEAAHGLEGEPIHI
jgi:dihydrolipoamide dehydrogenase